MSSDLSRTKATRVADGEARFQKQNHALSSDEIHTDPSAVRTADDPNPKGRRRCFMKWTNLYGAVVAMLGMVASAQAGSIVLTSHSCCGAEKSCGCAPSCQPQCCRPVICKPACPNIYNYQRTCAKPQCCNAAPSCAPKCAAPANCAAPAACAPANCAAPCGPAACAPANCAAPCAPKCAAPA